MAPEPQEACSLTVKLLQRACLPPRQPQECLWVRSPCH